MVVADVADPEEARTAMATAIDELDGLDVLVNNAGILRFADVVDITVAEWDLVFATNVRSMLVTTQAAVPALRRSSAAASSTWRAWGRRSGRRGRRTTRRRRRRWWRSPEVCAQELGPDGITVNCLCPGYVLTELGAATRTPEQVATWAARSPLGRLAEPSDVAAMALFLSSDEGAYCTGQALNVSGGMIFH